MKRFFIFAVSLILLASPIAAYADSGLGMSNSFDTDFLSQFSEAQNPTSGWRIGFTNLEGTQTQAGNGMPASDSFANVLWGNNTLAAKNFTNAGASTALLKLAEGGGFAAVGTPIGDHSRIAVDAAQTADQLSDNGDLLSASKAEGYSAGFMTQLTKGIGVSLTAGYLQQKNGLLNETYPSIEGYGPNHSSMSFGAATSFGLGEGRALMLDAAWIRTDAATMSDNMLDHVSATHSRSFGAAFIQNDALFANDSLSFGVSRPLETTSGSATTAVLNIDNQGFFSLDDAEFTLRSPVPETRFNMTYTVPGKFGLDWLAMAQMRRNADNIQGYNTTDFMVGAKLTF